MLYYGGNFLVSGCTRLAKFCKISPFVIGATIVGFGTSAPELAVSGLASLHGYGDIALANVIGSNVANIGLVLGLTALLVPLTIDEKRFKEEAPSLVLATFLIVGLAWDNYLSLNEGIFMLILLVIYLWKSLTKTESGSAEIEEDSNFLKTKRPSIQVCLVIAGLILIVFGANWMVTGATGIARGMGISEWFIGISIVAVGTSLPELVFSIIAAKRGHGEMAIGNIFGSNIFNALMVIGIASTINPIVIRESIHKDLTFLAFFTLLLLILIHRKNTIKKKEGVLLTLCYGTYIVMSGVTL